MPPSIQVCRSQVDEVQRLRCYDAAVDGTMQASVPAVPAVEALTNMPMFSAKVAALSFRSSGAVNVTLDNGQVWTQYGPEGRVPLRAGDSVTLRPSLFGASVLVGPSGWITKVHLIPASATGPNGK